MRENNYKIEMGACSKLNISFVIFFIASDFDDTIKITKEKVIHNNEATTISPCVKIVLGIVIVLKSSLINPK